jgi:N-hydroxyarylamine O-acetyltransferase
MQQQTLTAANFSLASYLQRIDFAGEPTATLEGVTALMRQQLHTVPFENLDVQAGKRVSLDPEHIVEKIIGQRRGGYCYEINGLFSMALAALGVTHIWVAARPMFYPARRPKTHMAVVVQLQGRQYLCDLGFGSYGITAPLALDTLDEPVLQGHDQFKLSRQSDGDLLLQAWVDGAWANQYAFDLTPQEWVDFEPANHLNSTHPEAVFVKSLLVIAHNPHGRHILFGQVLKTIAHGQVSKRSLQSGEVAGVLRELFNLTAQQEQAWA